MSNLKESMKNFRLIFLVLLGVFAFQSISAQKKPQKIPQISICNGIATYLPKPEISRAAIDAKAVGTSGVVNVQILIDEEGRVVSAKAVSGHPILRPEAEQAALKAKFKVTTYLGKPIKVSCVIVYNFKNDSADQSNQIKEEKPRQNGIINGMATFLPKPVYPQEASDFCAEGEVEVEVLIDENGRVQKAAAISGDELLRKTSVEAAKKAKFRPPGWPVRVKGIVVYNFVPKQKCITVGVVNEKAKVLPKPVINGKISKETTIDVQIIVDVNGDVIRAKALSGPPLLRAACENSARKTKFAPTLINGPPILVRAILRYKFKPDGTVEL